MKQFELIVKLDPLNDICVGSDTRDDIVCTALCVNCVTYGSGLHNMAAATTSQGFIGFSKTHKMVLFVPHKDTELFKLTR